MKTITVEVTQDDIANGKQGECGFCPIALALNRHAPANHHFTVGSNTATLCREDRNDSIPLETASLPLVASRFVYDFDHTSTVRPFTFKIGFHFLHAP